MSQIDSLLRQRPPRDLFAIRLTSNHEGDHDVSLNITTHMLNNPGMKCSASSCFALGDGERCRRRDSGRKLDAPGAPDLSRRRDECAKRTWTNSRQKPREATVKSLSPRALRLRCLLQTPHESTSHVCCAVGTTWLAEGARPYQPGPHQLHPMDKKILALPFHLYH